MTDAPKREQYFWTEEQLCAGGWARTLLEVKHGSMTRGCLAYRRLESGEDVPSYLHPEHGPGAWLPEPPPPPRLSDEEVRAKRDDVLIAAMRSNVMLLKDTQKWLEAVLEAAIKYALEREAGRGSVPLGDAIVRAVREGRR